jgi:hypothetical protein
VLSVPVVHLQVKYLTNANPAYLIVFHAKTILLVLNALQALSSITLLNPAKIPMLLKK